MGRAVSAAVLAWWLAAAAPAQGAAELLEKAVYTEEAVGDVDSALTLYRQVIDDAQADRPYVAQAYYRLGMALIKTGKDDEGYAALDKLVQQYPDQAELVRKAQEALTARVRDAVPEDDPRAWFYIDSRELPTGQPATLQFTIPSPAQYIPAPVPPEADSVLISYLSDGSYGNHQQISVALNDKNRILLRFPPPSEKGNLERAVLVLPVKLPDAMAPRQPMEISIHAVESEWQEPSATWLNQPNYNPQPVATATVPPQAGSVTVDITPLAREWLSGARPNYGVLIKSAVPYFGASPLAPIGSEGKYKPEEVLQMDIDTLFRRMVYGEVARAYYAGFWGLLAKANSAGPDARATIANLALEGLNDKGRWTYERWLCAYLLAALQDQRALDALTAVLKDDLSVPVREGAAGALGELGTPEARAALDQAAPTEPVERVRQAIRQALNSKPSKGEASEPVATSEAPGPWRGSRP